MNNNFNHNKRLGHKSSGDYSLPVIGKGTHQRRAFIKSLTKQQRTDYINNNIVKVSGL